MANTHFSGPLFIAGVEIVDSDGNVVAPVEVSDLEEILDANGNEILEFDSNDSAVNHLRVQNQATGSNPSLEAVGDDTNIDLQLTSKGTGKIIVGDSGTGTVAGGSANIDAQRGVVTTETLTASTASVETFDLVNNKIGTDSQVLVSLGDTTNTTGLLVLGSVTTQTAGSATIELVNTSTTESLNGTANIVFQVLN